MNFLLQFILTKVIRLLQKREVCVRDLQNGTSRIIVKFLYQLSFSNVLMKLFLSWMFFALLSSRMWPLDNSVDESKYYLWGQVFSVSFLLLIWQKLTDRMRYYFTSRNNYLFTADVTDVRRILFKIIFLLRKGVWIDLFPLKVKFLKIELLSSRIV